MRAMVPPGGPAVLNRGRFCVFKTSIAIFKIQGAIVQLLLILTTLCAIVPCRIYRLNPDW